MSKAQIASLDVFIALSLFVFILATFFSVYNYVGEKNLSDLEYKEMAAQALAISDGLVKTSGNPSNWDRNDVEVFGLASEDRVISRQKAEEFCAVSESEAAVILGVNYFFYFNVGNVSCGRVPSGSKIAVVKRDVYFEGQNSRLEFTLWR